MRQRSSTRRSQLIEAARLELETSGFANFSLERVAERANCNKNVVYRHLRSRDEAILTAWTSLLQDRSKIQSTQPANLADGLQHWLISNQRQSTFFQLLSEEARTLSEPILREEREAYYRIQVQNLSKSIMSTNSEMTFMALLSMVTLPFVLPQIFSLVTQKEITPESLAEYQIAIHELIQNSNESEI